MKKVLTILSFMFLFTFNVIAQATVPCIQIMSTSTPELFRIKSVFPKDKLMVEEWNNKGVKSYRIMIVCKDKIEANQKRLHYSREFGDAYVTMRTEAQVEKMFPFDFQFAISEPNRFNSTPPLDHSMISMDDVEFLMNTLFFKFEDRNGIKSHKQGIKVTDLPYYMYYAFDAYLYHIESNNMVSEVVEEIILAWMGDMNE
jgi:hypothetical protein